MDIINNKKDQEFFKKFYNEVKIFENIFYKSFVNNIDNFKKNSNWPEMEIVGFIILNKIFFQHVKSFFLLLEEKIYVACFNELRTIIEIFRLIRLYSENETFRKDYLKNNNIDFYIKGDYSFSQFNINKKLDEIESELRNREDIPLSLVLQNHEFTKGSNLANLHSELSKWSHALNVNLIFPLFSSKGRIDLDICNELNIYSVNYIKKYIETIYIIIIDHFILIDSCVSLNINNEIDSLFELYDLFIKKNYK